MSHSTAYFLVGQSYVYVPPKNTAPQKMFGYLFHFVLATILSTGLTDANKSVYNQLDDSAAFQDEQFLPSGSIFLESSLPDDIILDDTWRYRPFPGIQVPVVRSPYPTFGSPWPLPQFWSSSFCYYNLDSENFNFKLNKISNDILKSAINRYTYIIQNKLGFGIYPKIWQHDDYKLPTYNFKNYQLECRRNAGKSHQYDSNTGKNTYKSNIMRRKNHMPFVSHRPYTSYRQYISGQISRLIKKYKLSSLIMPYTGSQKFALLHVIKSGSSWPHIDMDESYILGVSEDGILIVANETWGALRALETLSQLMWTSGDQSYVFINETYIEDFPRFKHRGLMLDTSRHYMSKSVILLNLEAMSYNKLNVFHWHIVDDQSFPYQSHAFPELSAKGAYREDLVYTSKDISEILEFARFRGIRVIPEFDIPGHTRSVSLSHPEIMSQCSQKTGYFGPLNPALNRTYTFLEKLFNEVFSLFVDEYIHLGGDEVETVCWKSDPHIMQSEQYSTQFSPTFWNNYFWRQVQNLVTRIGNSNPDLRRNLIVWQDVLNHVTEVKKTSLIQVWSTSPTSYLSQGHNIVYSTCWYLDSLNDIKRWTDFYLCDPANDAPINTQQQIFGGEACMWSEYQSDYTVLLRIWPTTSAVAERLWSPRDTVDLVYAGPRIEEQRCRLINRGIPAGVLLGPGYCEGRKPQISPWDVNEIVLDEHKNIKPGIKWNPHSNSYDYDVNNNNNNGNNDNCHTTTSIDTFHLWNSGIDLLIGIFIGIIITFLLRNRNFSLFRKFSRTVIPKYAVFLIISTILVLMICLDRKYSTFSTVWNGYYYPHHYDSNINHNIMKDRGYHRRRGYNPTS